VFKRIVNVVEVLALVAALGFVVALGRGSDSGSGAGAGGSGSGEEIYASSCASCHGDSGQGGVGPQLGDGAVVEAYPDAADEIAVVEQGLGGGRMPSFADRLSEEQIRAVVEYTRTDLGN
jgi:mono/diheme cytochrome c family protein